MSSWSVTLTTVLDQPVSDADARRVAAAVATTTGTQLVSVLAQSLMLSIVVEESNDDLPDATALFSAYEQAVAVAGYAIVSWEAVELVTNPSPSPRGRQRPESDTNGPTVSRAG